MKSITNGEAENKQILKGAISLSISAVIVKIIGVIYKIPIAYLLGDEGMGYFNSAYTVYGFFYIICTAGLPKALTIVIAQMQAYSDESEIDYAFKKVFRIFIAFGLVITLFVYILSPVICLAIGSSNSLPSMLLIIPSIFFITVAGAVRGYLNGSMNIIPIAISQLIEGIFKLVFGLAFAFLGVRFGLSLKYICALAIFGITVSSFVSAVYLLIKCKKKKTSKKTRQNYDFSLKFFTKRIIKIALPITVSSSVLSLSAVLDLAFIMRRLMYSGYTEIMAAKAYGNYTTLVIPMLNLIVAIVSPISVAILPKLAVDYELSDNIAFSTNMNRATLITVMISAPAAFMFSAYSFEILDILFSSEASMLAAPLLHIISPSVILLCLLTVLNTALEAIGKIKVAVASTVVGVVIKLFLSYFLIGNKLFGISGAAIGTTVSYGISMIISFIFLFSTIKCINVFSSVVKPILIAYIAVFLPLYFKITFFSGEKTIPLCIIFCIFSIILYAIMMFIAYRNTGIIKLFSNSKQKKY